MDKVQNIKDKFYLLKKHLRDEQFESLQKYSNVSLFKILKIIKKKQNEEKETNKISRNEKNQFQTIFSLNQNENIEPNKNNLSEKKIKNIKDSMDNKNKEIKEKIENRNIINNFNNQINYPSDKKSNIYYLNNIKNNEEILKKKVNDSMSIESNSSSLKSNEEKNNVSKEVKENKEKDNFNNHFENFDENIFDKKYMLSSHSDFSNNNSPINSIQLDENIEKKKYEFSNQNYLNNNILFKKNNNNQIKTNLEKSPLNINKSDLYKKNIINQNKKEKIINKYDNQILEEKKVIKKNLKSNKDEFIKNNNNKSQNSPFRNIDIDINKTKTFKDNKTRNLTINNNNSNIGDNNNKIIVNQTNIFLTDTKFQIPLLDLDKIEQSENKLGKVKDILNINNNMNINTNNINNVKNDIKQNNQNIKISPLLNQKKDFYKKDNNKNESSNQIINNKIINDDDEKNKKIIKDKIKIEKEFDLNKNVQSKLKDNPYVSLNGTQIKLKLDDNQLFLFNENKSHILENNNIKKETFLEKDNIKSKNLFLNHKNLNLNESKNNINNIKDKNINKESNYKKIINDNKTISLDKKKDKDKEIGYFTKKESSAYLLSQLHTIIKEMKENYKTEYQDNYKNNKILKNLEYILNTISDLEKLEINKRRKSSCKQIPKLISILFKSLEEEKKNDFLLKNVISILDSIKFFFHEMKLNYLEKEGKVPIRFSQLKTVIKYIYSLFKIKSFTTKILKEFIKRDENKKIINFTKCYKTYQNSSEKLFNLLKKICDDKQFKKYDNLNLYLEMDPCKIKHYSELFKQGRKMIDFIFDYIDRTNSNEKRVK